MSGLDIADYGIRDERADCDDGEFGISLHAEDCLDEDCGGECLD